MRIVGADSNTPRTFSRLESFRNLIREPETRTIPFLTTRSRHERLSDRAGQARNANTAPIVVPAQNLPGACPGCRASSLCAGSPRLPCNPPQLRGAYCGVLRSHYWLEPAELNLQYGLKNSRPPPNTILGADDDGQPSAFEWIK